jgi:hypothetical protein
VRIHHLVADLEQAFLPYVAGLLRQKRRRVLPTGA